MDNYEQKKKEWIFREYYGLPQAPEGSDCIQFGKALLCCANGDGELTNVERQWVIGFSYTNGVAQDEVQQFLTYDCSDSLHALMKSRPILKNAQGVLIYDAIRACDSDGTYNEGEQATIRKMAKQMGLTEMDVERIEDAWTAEKQAKAERIAAIFPAGQAF